MQLTLAQQKAQLTQLRRRLASQDMARLHRAESDRVNQLQRRLGSAMQRQLATRQTRLTSAARELNAVSPLAVLIKYTICRYQRFEGVPLIITS